MPPTMIHEVSMPALSSTMEMGKIVSWLKHPGDRVEKGENILVVESDKADMDVESFYAGILASIVVPAGESAPVGAPIALIAESEAEVAQAQEKA
ncbi:MAG: biotin/lipoyl-containing protein, partial [Thermostichus sp. BF3_bins_97]